ncbi:hypothetical protein [Micromonospora fulviviridis]|uniref:Rad50/SbcC-type AAA domain-containing protein n=1 Tax=Micromonospora fulviviridis TaxID=47860 RepID=A0ABV2VVA3_9ACTN
MTLKLEHLQLRAETPRGLFGADVPLGGGLVVLRAENSRGKSTAVRSILFALGLERMITAKASSLVTAAMRDTLIYDSATKAETPVRRSWVSLEISNQNQEIVTLTRWVKDSTISDGVIRVTHGPALTSVGVYPSEDFFVGRGGSVTSPRGFHNWLARFIGWELPELPARDGRTAPLYMEQVFPLLFVEQKRGWAGIQAQMPYFSAVTDVRKRAIEFLLALEIGGRELRRQELQARLRSLDEQWKSTHSRFMARTEGSGISVAGIPAQIRPGWSPGVNVGLLAAVDDGWVPVTEQIRAAKADLEAATGRAARSVGEVSSKIEGQLREALDRSTRIQENGAILRDEILRDQEELAAIEGRLNALADDLRQYQDVATLERLGAHTAADLRSDCPVCHRELPETLLGSEPANLMSIQDSINYIKQQVELFNAMEQDGRRVLEAKREQLAGFRAEASATRSLIRRLRTDLTSPNSILSEEEVAERIILRQKIEKLERLVEEFDTLQAQLDRLASAAESLRQELSEIPKDRFTDLDEKKIEALRRSFVKQLQEYDFGSFSDERLRLSADDYLPRRDDFDLQADISASDSIRVIWAYLIGLLEVSGQYNTNHPGFLVFDEPRQQSAKDVSFAALLRRASAHAASGQVILATSEKLEPLSEMLQGLPVVMHDVAGYLLQPI